jgi:hypothetical protein
VRRGTGWWLVIPIGGYVRFVGDRKAASAADGGASELVDRDARQRESCSATAADADRDPWTPGRPPISLRRSQLLRPRGSAASSSLAVRRSLAPHAPRPQPSLDDRSTTRSKKVINFVSLGPAQAIAIKIGRGGKMMINAKANFWRCSTSRPCGRASAGLGSRSPGIEATCELFVPSLAGALWAPVARPWTIVAVTSD